MSFDPNLLHNNGHSGFANGTSGALRETGVIEKLLASYGFIQCTERQARLFFHCSQYSGNLQDLKVGGEKLSLLDMCNVPVVHFMGTSLLCMKWNNVISRALIYFEIPYFNSNC